MFEQATNPWKGIDEYAEAVGPIQDTVICL